MIAGHSMISIASKICASAGNTMVDFRKILLQATKPAVEKIVTVQHHFLTGNGEVKYKLFEKGIGKQPVTIADKRAQAIYMEHFNRAIGLKNIYYENEEALRKTEIPLNNARKATAIYRIAIDPIDGTNNYCRKGNGGEPARSSLEEVNLRSLRRHKLRIGWGSMVAIQHRQTNGSWKTVASAIYESNSRDTRDNLQGKFYLAEGTREGVGVIDLQTWQEKPVISACSLRRPKIVIEGGFSDDRDAQKTRLAITRYVRSKNYLLLDLSCVAQSALAVITAKARGFFKGIPICMTFLPQVIWRKAQDCM
jgi:Inositol monophosphatase family